MSALGKAIAARRRCDNCGFETADYFLAHRDKGPDVALCNDTKTCLRRMSRLNPKGERR